MRERHGYPSLLLILGLGLAGCGELADGPLTRSTQAIWPTLAPAYRLVLRSETRFVDLQSSEPSTIVTRIVALAWTEQGDEGELQLVVKPCSVALPPVRGFDPRLPAATLEPLSLALAGTMSQDAGGVALTTAPAALTIGARLAKPLVDPFPSTTGDRRIVDEDDDGNPGASVSVSVFKVYVALRLVVALEGRVLENGDRLSGKADMRLDELILGDNVPFVDVAEEVKDASARNKLVSTASAFEMRPIDVASCAQLE